MLIAYASTSKALAQVFKHAVSDFSAVSLFDFFYFPLQSLVDLVLLQGEIEVSLVAFFSCAQSSTTGRHGNYSIEVFSTALQK